MNRQNIEKHAYYSVLASITGSKPASVKKWHSRNGIKGYDPIPYLSAHGWRNAKSPHARILPGTHRVLPPTARDRQGNKPSQDSRYDDCGIEAEAEENRILE